MTEERWKITKEYVVECALCLHLFRTDAEMKKHFEEAHPGKDFESYSFWTFADIAEIERRDVTE